MRKISEHRLKRAVLGGKAIHLVRKDRDNKRQDNGTNRVYDEIIGKIGEEAVCEITGCSNPDYQIYRSPEHEFDLPELKASVKSCRFEYIQNKNDKNGKNGPSFLIPWKEILPYDIEDDDGNIVDGYFFPENGRFIFMLVNEKCNGEYVDCGWIYIKELRDIWNQIALPPYASKITTKKAIYLCDIESKLQPLSKIGKK